MASVIGPNLSFLPFFEDCDINICVNCTSSSSCAIQKMENLLKLSNEKIEAHPYFPLDDRTVLDVPDTHRKYTKLAQATVSAFHESTLTFDRFDPPLGIVELDAVLLVTKSGVAFVLYKTSKVHPRLLIYCQWIKSMCLQFGPFSDVRYPDRTPNHSTILFLPDFKPDDTHLRRARYINRVDSNEFFVEMETGMIRKLHYNESDMDATQFRPSFQKSPSYVRLHLANREKMTAAEILAKMIRIAKTKKLNILRIEEDRSFRRIGVFDEVVDNPLEGFWPSDSDSE